MSVVHDTITKTCAQCGREFGVSYPDQWAYKTGAARKKYFCSWSCLRQAETEGKINMAKLTLDDKKHAVKIALDGGNPLEYIRACGVKNAAESWMKIKDNLRLKDPETWEKLPKRLPNQKKGEDVIMADEVPIATPIPPLVMDPVIEKFADHLKGNEAIEMPTAEEVIPKEFQKHMKPGALKKREKKFSQPSICNGFEVIGIRGQYGVYRANDEVNYFDFQPFGGELCMSPEDWHEQLDELHRAAKVLGVEL